MGSTIGLAVLGSHILLETLHFNVASFSWIPIVSLSATLFVQGLAISTLKIAVTAELLPERLREFGLTVCTMVIGTSAFISLKFTPLLCELIGFPYTLYMFGGFCILGTIFVILCVPETKGKTYDEIQNLLGRKRAVAFSLELRSPTNE